MPVCCKCKHRVECGRSSGRWAALVASALFAASVLPYALWLPPAASAADCPDAEVVFARGTDEPAGLGRVGDAFVDSLRQQTGGMDIGTYAVNYKAGKLQLHGGDGANDVISHIKSTVSSCPDTRIVLGGYSQGASVIDIVAGVQMGGIAWGDSLPPQYANNVVAVATFGDVAGRTGGSLPTQSALLGSKAIDLCNPGDPICHAGPGNAWSGHTEGYVPGVHHPGGGFCCGKAPVRARSYGARLWTAARVWLRHPRGTGLKRRCMVPHRDTVRRRQGTFCSRPGKARRYRGRPRSRPTLGWSRLSIDFHGSPWRIVTTTRPMAVRIIERSGHPPQCRRARAFRRATAR